ncbi:MAG: thymidine phosphorylase [Candidatus Pacearchaeota archaeon]
MKLKVKILKFLAGRPVCILHRETAEKLNVNVSERVLIKKKPHKPLISIIDTSTQILNPNEIAVSDEIIQRLKLKENSLIEVDIASTPHSVELIKEKLKGKILSKEEIDDIVTDISKNALTEVEIAFLISGIYEKGLNFNETRNFIQSMLKNSNVLRLRGKVVDKHCIGGIAGNRTTPIIVAICASAGLVVPKTSSRAITSAAGTADTIETLAQVMFETDELKKIIKKTKACMVWGGALGLVPVDSKIIEVERTVHIDSESQMLASIMSKKLSVDSKYILIDIPCGKSAKVSKTQAEKLKDKFIKIGNSFGIKMKVVLTDGTNPIGNGVGPALEMIDVLKVLQRESPPADLEEKSIMLAGELLELAGKAKKGKGKEIAYSILNSGKAFKKFEQIIKAQHGKIKSLSPGKFSFNIYAKTSKKISHIDNKLLNSLARFSGCPEDKSAGIYLHKKQKQEIKKGDKIMTVYAESREKLENARKYYNKIKKRLIEF